MDSRQHQQNKQILPFCMQCDDASPSVTGAKVKSLLLKPDSYHMIFTVPSHITDSIIIRPYRGDEPPDAELCVLYNLVIDDHMSVDYRFRYGPCYERRPYICQTSPRRRHPRYPNSYDRGDYMPAVLMLLCDFHDVL